MRKFLTRAMFKGTDEEWQLIRDCVALVIGNPNEKDIQSELEVYGFDVDKLSASQLSMLTMEIITRVMTHKSYNQLLAESGQVA